MNSKKLSSSKELTVISVTKKIGAIDILNRISMHVRTLFGRLSDNPSGKNAPNTNLEIMSNVEVTPLEDMMNHIAIGVAGLPDESVITLARGLHMVFGKGVEQDRKTKIKYINYVIMPFIGEGEELPTMFIGNIDIIINKFRTIVKERIGPIMKQKVARLH